MTKSILITGCSSGIGRHCALGMKDIGWRVFATARNPADIAVLEALGLEPLYLDYCDEQSIEAALSSVLEATGGRLDALFNNGGYAQPGAVEDLTSAALREQFDVNFFGWHDLTRRVIPVMRTQGAGRIAMNSSILGFIALAFRGAYTASKFAVEAYADTLRIELHGSGIHVSLIEPGPIKSRMGLNTLKAAHKHLDWRNSFYEQAYRSRLSSLENGGNTFGELGPEAVLKPLIHACESKRPRHRYRVTVPTQLAALARRALPTGIFERLLVKASKHS